MEATQVDKEMRMLDRFVQVYCRHHHGAGDQTCDQCRDLLSYARTRLEKCPFAPKPKCKDCKVHCYLGDYRDRIRQVMRFSGMYFIKRGRLDWLLHFLIRR